MPGDQLPPDANELHWLRRFWRGWGYVRAALPYLDRQLRGLDVAEIVKTNLEFPALWLGKLQDGRHLYIRYQQGRLVVALGVTAADIAVTGQVVYDARLGPVCDGNMRLAEVRAFTRLKISPELIACADGYLADGRPYYLQDS
ncbi:hypothetical protein FHS83_001537 [Rhizomicrobium palustre]|uniref:Uncharacterized protein n=1 Tax=Rhizomicrobium palustre TaxID=189966 RepID=A0A846MYA8_9PROT|nr:hypothetical protein [Rhizomicrobium palustre]NIK88219.1 hypothetical protein [Rhizomicrobium palustre]